jgi:glycosyltransferase involved in cell wall biosynthesis
MKVSVVVRAFNRGYVIREALASALQQTHDDFEVIVVDDGSTDDTSEVVQEFVGDNVRYIRHETNKGVSAAANTGIRAATGDLIANLDTDDLWHPEMLSTLVEFLGRHPEVGAAFCDVELLRDGEEGFSIAWACPVFRRLLTTRQPAAPGEWVFTQRDMRLCLLEEVPIKTIAIVFRREVFQDVGGYDETWSSGEDWELYQRVSRKYRFGYVDRQLTTQRVMGDSTLEKHWEADRTSLRRLMLAERRTLKGDREAVRTANRAIAMFENDLAWTYLHSGQRSRSITTYLRGFAETGDPTLLAKSASAFLPRSLRSRLRRASGR